MKCDDDTFVRLGAVLAEVRKIPNDKSLYVGNMNYYHKPLREGKWAVTYEVMKSFFFFFSFGYKLLFANLQVYATDNGCQYCVWYYLIGCRHASSVEVSLFFFVLFWDCLAWPHGWILYCTVEREESTRLVLLQTRIFI